MTDIVFRLREDAALDCDYCCSMDEILEAANEIELLRKRVSELEAAIEKEYMDDAKELAESAITKAPQEQAFNIWGESKGSFGFDYLEVWNAACAWQREKIKQSLTIYDDTEDSDCVLSFYRYKELFK